MPQHDDLAMASHGRRFWSLDNIAPLRQLQAGTTVRVPLPQTVELRAEISEHMRNYFRSIVGERESYDAVVSVEDARAFGTR